MSLSGQMAIQTGNQIGPRNVETTVDLLARVHEGDQRAWDVLIDRVRRPLKQLGHSRLPSHARSLSDTDDVVQDALVATVKRLRHFDCRHSGALLAYLRRAVLNRIVDEARKSNKRGPAVCVDGLVDHQPSPLECVLQKEEQERFRTALGLMRPRDRQLILLRAQHRLTYAALAERLEFGSPDAARIASRRALSRLLAALKRLK